MPIILAILINLILPNFSFAQPISLPETLKEAKVVGENVLNNFSGVLKEIWQEFLKPWQKVGNWFKKIWDSYFWSKISPWGKELKEELERRKIIIKEEFPKEKKELKEEVPKVSKSLWERFKELIK